MDSFRCNARSAFRGSAMLVALIALTACGSRPPAPVVDRSTPRVAEAARPAAPAAASGGSPRPVVEPAAANAPVAVAQPLPARRATVSPARPATPDTAASEPAPLRFEPVNTDNLGGQRAAIPSAAQPTASAASQRVAPQPPPPAAAPAPGTIAGTFQPQPPPREPGAAPVPQAGAPVADAPAATPPAPAAASSATSGASAAAAARPAAGGERFGWPVPGKVLEPFSEPQNPAIYLDGRPGDPVNAAADGRVIFSGQFKGYGNLVIIKHDEELVSVYGHNRSLQVSQGDQVKRGQKIAELGNSDSDRPRLRFEIRREGRPIDPLRYLPPR